MSPSSLKVVNSESSDRLQELIADYPNVYFFPSSNVDELFLVGYCDRKLFALPVTYPDRVQVIPFEDVITSFTFSSEGICLTLGTNKVGTIRKVINQWECASVHSFNLGIDRNIVGCFPLATGKIVFVQHSPNWLIVGFSENPPEWQQIAKIDCIKAAESVFACHSPLSTPQCCILIIGTQDGHVYQLQLNNKNLKLLCDIQQPVVSILNVNNQVVVLGKYGKIVLLDDSTEEALVSFAPTSISSGYQSEKKLYLMGSEKLYSIDLKHSRNNDSSGETNYCKVKFVRTFDLRDNFVFILTENGTIYQSGLVFESQEEHRPRSGAEIKPILLEIHRSVDRTKALNAVSERVRLDIAQLSIALHILNQDVGDHFPIIVRSFADPIHPKSQRLNITITNQSSWNLSSSHWAFQISVRRTDHSFILLRQEWKMGDKLELEHRFELLDDAFDVQLKMSLAFRVADSRKEYQSAQPVCVFPLSTVELSVLDFLEPLSSDMFELKNNLTDVVGFSRKKVHGCPWPIILHRSWHRCFGPLGDPPPMQIALRCGSHQVRLTLKEDENPSDKIWILRIETSNWNLLRLLRTGIFREIENHYPPAKSEVVTVPCNVLAHLESLRGRLNYIQSLSSWDESDTEPVMEEIRLLVAKQFSIR